MKLNIWTKISYLFIILFLVVSVNSCSNEKNKKLKSVQKKESAEIAYYTCGMHPSVKVSVEDFNQGSTQCPICNMNLIPVPLLKNEAAQNTAGVKQEKGYVSIPQDQLSRAGVLTEEVMRRVLCKKIRTVGSIAYDPELLVAQEELISSLQSQEKLNDNANPQIKENSQELVEAAKKKLQLLGLSKLQIEQIVNTRQTQQGLVLPAKTMWVYGEIYEFEISWVDVGAKVVVTTESFPGEQFKGEIAAIAPVINPKTRSVKIRAQVKNSQLKLKPNMYVDLIIEGNCAKIAGEDKVIALPQEALLDTGTREIVWVEIAPGKFQKREVEVAAQATAFMDGVERNFYPVLKGINTGEKVVTRGNFLVDSQSQISGTAAVSYSGALSPEAGSMRNMQH